MKPFKILAILLVMIGANCIAQDSLNYYIKVGINQNPQIKAKYNMYKASLEMVPQAASLPDPELSIGYFITPKQELMGNQVADIKLMQMFPWIGTLKAAKNEANSMASARQMELYDEQNQLKLEISKKYYQLYLINKEIAMVNNNLKIAETTLQLSLASYKTGGTVGVTSPEPEKTQKQQSSNQSGMSGNNAMQQSSEGMSNQGSGNNSSVMVAGKGMIDVLQAQMNIRELSNQLQSLKDKQQFQVAEFNLLLNRNEKELVTVQDTIEDFALRVDSLSIADSSVFNNSMAKMYSSERASLLAKAQKTKRMGYPMVGIGLDYMVLTPRQGNTEMDNGKDMVMPMLTITLPIYRKKYNAMQREVGYTLNSTIEKQNALINNLKTSYYSTLQEIKDADRKIELYKWQIEVNRQTSEILIATYKSTGSGFEDVLKIQQKTIETQFKLIESIVEKLTAKANLEYLISAQL